MNAEIITIGDEILIGQVVDSNSAWIAEALNGIGIRVVQITSISDTSDAITNAMDDACLRAKLVLLTGGLGPTSDDITKKTLTEYFGCQLVKNEEALEQITEFLTSRGVEMNEFNLSQAMVPDCCRVIPNRFGTAPGMWFQKEGIDIISMPGVPYEMKGMMRGTILPDLKKDYNLPFIIHKTILTQGIAESHLARLMKDYEAELPEDIKMAYLPSPGMVRLRFTTSGPDKKILENKLDKAVKKLNSIIPEYIVGTEDEKLEKSVGELLVEMGSTLSTAESCTGGSIASLITSVPGSSRYFTGSVIAYSNEIKKNILGVSSSNLEKHGAVSEAVIIEMVKGVRELYKTDYAIATSGIAGPEGGTDEKPVGTTWIAVASGKQVIVEKYQFGDHRNRNIRKATLTALNMLRKLILAEK